MVIAPLPLPSLYLSSVATASCAVVLRKRRWRLTIARARVGWAATISAISWTSASMPISRSSATSRISAIRRVSSCEEKKVASTPKTSLIRSRTGTVSGLTSCSIWLR